MAPPTPATTTAIVHFELGSERFGFRANEIQTVLSDVKLLEVPGAPATVAGVGLSKGEALTVLDAHQLILGKVDERVTSHASVIQFTEPWSHVALRIVTELVYSAVEEEPALKMIGEPNLDHALLHGKILLDDELPLYLIDRFALIQRVSSQMEI